MARDRLAYSVYEKGQNRIYAIEGPRMAGTALSDAGDRTRAAMLPPRERPGAEVAALHREPTFGLPTNQKVVTAPYKPKLTLDYVGQSAIGIGTGPTGTFVGGGVALPVQRRPGRSTTWAPCCRSTGASRTSGASSATRTGRIDGPEGADLPGPVRHGPRSPLGQALSGAIIERSELYRETHRGAESYIAYPFSKASRFEVAAAVRHISFGREIETVAFDPFTGQVIAQDRQKLDAPDGIGFAETSAALVYDTSLFGPTSPILGQRYRFEVTPTFGGWKYTTVLADYRRYVMPRAARHPGRTPHPLRALWQRRRRPAHQPALHRLSHLMRGYDVNSFNASECGLETLRCPVFDQLVGSRIAVANLELRLPAAGPLQPAATCTAPSPSRLIAFSDWGVAWTGRTTRRSSWATRAPARS